LNRQVLVVLALALSAFGSACGSGAESTRMAEAVPPGSDHACVVPGGAPPSVAWSKMRNPVLSYAAAAVKDQALVWANGRWHMVFSYVTDSTSRADRQTWAIASSESGDLEHWTSPSIWSEQPGGMASPDIVRDPDGTFVATYDSPPAENGPVQAKLYYRTSKDLEHWSAPTPLAQSLYRSSSQRMIDGALAWTGNGLMLAYKVGTTSQSQAFEIAWSPSGSLAGPWRIVGRPDIKIYGDTVENYELVSIGGRWRLVATSNTLDQPWLFSLSGNPQVPSSWLHWTGGYELTIPSAPWDTGTGISSVGYEHANSAFLCDDSSDGFYYLTYAGSTDLTSFGGWGHAEIGIARSHDLVHWQVPA
jgi:hypothetical protein